VASEEGVVVRTDASGTWVKTIRSDACDSCSSKSTCHTLGGGNEMEVAAINSVGAKVGDRVVLKMHAAAFLKGTFLIYIFPLLLLLGGAGLGEWASVAFDRQSPLTSIVFGFGGLAVGLMLMKRMANRLAERDEYRPRIARVIGRAPG